MSELRTNRIIPRDGLASGYSGGIIQIKQTVVSVHTFNTTSTSKVDITGMSVAITPTRSDSKILVSSHLTYGGNNFNFYCDLLRDSTVLGAPSSGNNTCTIALCGITNTTYQMPISKSKIFPGASAWLVPWRLSKLASYLFAQKFGYFSE